MTYCGTIFLHRMRKFVTLCLATRKEAVLAEVKAKALKTTVPKRKFWQH